MNVELNQLWQELWIDNLSFTALRQLIVIASSVALGWFLNGLLRAYVMRYSSDFWKVGIEAMTRIIFPLAILLFVSIGNFILKNWQQTHMLKLASTLLIAMVVIRLAAYALRYIFAPGGWVRTMETSISACVWLLLALHLAGLLPIIIQVLNDISFHIGQRPITLLLLMQGGFTVLITLVIALWFSRVLENRVMRTAQISMNMRVVLSKLVRILISFFAILMALSAVGLDITFLSVFGGALGVGLGLGLQKIASNYVSGFIILMDRSMKIGDLITVDAHYGVVSEMRTRYMVLRKLDNTEVIIPNEVLITNAVINHSLSNRTTRVQMPVQVSYECALELAMKLMYEVALCQPRILKVPEPVVLIKGFGENGIDLNLSVWIADPEEGSAILQSAIYLEIWRLFQANSIVIPYPHREIRILEHVSGFKP